MGKTMKKEKGPRFVRSNGGVAAAKGFHAGAVTAGIKLSKAPDCGLLVSERPCCAAGAFTTNAVRASSVDWCERLLPSRSVRAVFCNSGNANACTGRRGEKDTLGVARLVGTMAGQGPGAVLIASTGVIGHFLPMDKIKKSLPGLYRNAVTSADRGSAFAGAIMTTDTVKKECALQVIMPRAAWTIGGCAKGSGMIHPRLATMLCFITTDAEVEKDRLSAMVKRVVGRTFNNLTIDGDTSTNDMVLVLANGMSGSRIKTPGEFAAFEQGLYVVADSLCRKIAADGEGATKRVEIRVIGAKTASDAASAAKSVANSSLVKTALFGNDPNWGRILCAIGYSGARFSEKKISLKLCGTRVFYAMRPLPFDAGRLSRRMKAPAVVEIDIDLGLGRECAIAHTCDLTYDYIKINAEYHT
jgi:glutamate N-acetyltransferase / amino-acid N-acetyltransferase